MIFKFGADGSQYSRTLNTMRSQTKKFTSTVGGLMKGAFAFAGIAGVKGLLGDMDRIQKLAKRFGLSAEVIQRMGFAAEQGGSSIEIMAKGMAQANRAAIEAGAGLKTYQRSFEDLNIDFREFAKLDQEQQFMVLADAVINATQKNKAMAASQALLGRAGLEMLPLLQQGAEGYKEITEGLKTFSDAQVDAAAAANDAANKLITNLKVGFVDFFSFIGKMVQGSRAALGQMGEMAEGDTIAEKIKSFFSPKTESEAFKIKLAFEEGVYGQELQDLIRERVAKGMADGISSVIDINQGLIDMGAPPVDTEDPAKRQKRLDKIADQRKKNSQVELTDAEKLVAINDEIARGLEEYGSMKGDRFTTNKDLEEKELELLQLQNKQLELKKKLKKDVADAGRSADELRDQINQEKKDREEAGMSPEQILARRKDELKAEQDIFSNLKKAAMSDGKIDEFEREKLNTQELEIEKRKSELADLEDTAAIDPSTSVIASSLASIGGGGGVAAFSNDPLFNESKKQTSLLGQLVKLQGGTIDGGATINPEL